MAALRVRTWVTLLCLAFVTVAPQAMAAGLGAAPCGYPGRLIAERHFLQVAVPAFPASDYPYQALIPSPQTVSSTDYGPGAAFRAAATDSATVQLTTDGGCTWRGAFSLPATVDGDGNSGPALANIDHIVSVAVGKPSGHALYVAVAGPNLHGTDLRVFSSTDDGHTSASHTLVGVGAGRLMTPPLEPRVVYLAGILSDNGGTSVLWRSTDSGAHWAQVPVPAGAGWHAVGSNLPLVADPAHPRRLWIFGTDAATTIYRSDNAGTSWHTVGKAGATAQTYSVWYAGGQPVLATAPEQGLPRGAAGSGTYVPYWTASLSRTGGRTWSRVHIPAPGAPSGYPGAALLDLAQPPRTGDLLTALVTYTPAGGQTVAQALTVTGARWSTTAQLRRPFALQGNAVSTTTRNGSVGTWWLVPRNGSSTLLLRYSREP